MIAMGYDVNIELLEQREMPSIYSFNGNVILPSGAEYRPFGDFNAANNVAGYDDVFVVGAAAMGGPRVQVVKSNSPIEQPEVLADFFAYEPTFLGGVNVSTDGKYVVTGAETNGGPVVAVFDTHGVQVSRFFAFEPSFGGGIDVQIRNDVIYVSAGVGGGPVVKMFDVHGQSLGAFFGAPASLRTGFSVLVVPDVVGHPTVDLVTPDGAIYVNKIGSDGMPNGQYQTHLPSDFKQVGWSGIAISFGMNGYITGDGIDLGFNELAPLYRYDDHAAGNQAPPPTTGFKQGVYFNSVSPFADFGGSASATAQVTDLSGESVGTIGTGTGTLWVPMVGPDGKTYAVTASHVTDLGNYELIAPGPADGSKQVSYGFPTIYTNYRTGNYTVDAAAVPTSLPIKGAVLFNGDYYPIDGVAVPQVGQPVIAVGRGFQTGLGIYNGPQTGFVNVSNGFSGGAQLSGQYVVGSSVYGPLAIPGFSGGPAFTITVDASGIHRWLVGMVIAGDGRTTYVTPVSAIENALNLKVAI